MLVDAPMAVLRMCRIGCNLTGRYNSPSANYVTFFVPGVI